MAIATIGRVLGKAGLAYLKKNKSKIKKELDSPESKQKVQEIMDKAKKGLGKKMLTGGQAEIAAKAPPPNKIDEKDFAVLRAEKAKGRGMGLQDESVQPGKVMKAKRGKLGEAKDYKKYLKGLKKATSELRAKAIKSPEYSPSNPYGSKSYRALGIKNEDAFYKERMKDPKFAKAVYKTKGNKSLPAAVDNRMRQLTANYRLDKINKNPKTKKMYEKGTTFGERRKKLMGAKSLIGKGGRLGAAITGLTIAGAGAAKLGQTIGKKIDEMKKKNKKMGGGMMNKPMGYSKGGGADSGTVGEMKSRIGVAMNKAKRLRSTDRLTERDIETANKILKGGRGKALKGTQEMLSRLKKMDTISRMGGGMIAPSQRPGYSKGTMVKARGCKLGRTRPTKIT